jgi:hypothetical protein
MAVVHVVAITRDHRLEAGAENARNVVGLLAHQLQDLALRRGEKGDALGRTPFGRKRLPLGIGRCHVPFRDQAVVIAVTARVRIDRHLEVSEAPWGSGPGQLGFQAAPAREVASFTQAVGRAHCHRHRIDDPETAQ